MIREMMEADVPAVCKILTTGYSDLAQNENFSTSQLELLLKQCCSPEAITSWLTKWKCFVYELHGQTTGTLAIEENDIAEIWLDSRYRRRGIGKTLFHHAEQVISGSGHDLLTVRCAAKTVQPFYSAMGCVVVCTKPCESGPLKGWPLTYYQKNLKV